MCSHPWTVEALALRDSAPQFQGRVRVIQVDILIGVHRGMTPHPSREKGCSFNNHDCNPTGGGQCLVVLPPSIKTFITHAYMLQSRKDSHDASRRQSSCHGPCGTFRGNLIQILRP